MVHRLALFDAGGALTNVISQSDVVKFVADHLDATGGLAAATVAELGLVQGTVISVRRRGWSGSEGACCCWEGGRGRRRGRGLRRLRRGGGSQPLLLCWCCVSLQRCHPTAN